MRIVGGRHRGRRLTAPAGMDVRPTTDRTRESLFNILAHAGWVAIEGAAVLDAFCGTGALGLEALSRGAERATFLDSAGPSLAATRANVAALGEEAHALVLRGDATRPPKAPTAHTLVFLDPPYGRDLAPRTLAALAAGGWLVPGALAVVEEAASATFALPEGFTALDERRYGDTALRFATLGGG